MNIGLMHRPVLVAALVAALVPAGPAAAAAQSPAPAAAAAQSPVPAEATPYDAYLTKVIAATESFPDDGKDWNDETLGATALVFREGQLSTFTDSCYYDLYVGQWRVYAAILDVTDASRGELDLARHLKCHQPDVHPITPVSRWAAEAWGPSAASIGDTSGSAPPEHLKSG